MRFYLQFIIAYFIVKQHLCLDNQSINNSLDTQNCHFSCNSCVSSSPFICIECSDVSRGYNGIPGYKNTCYCLGDYSESYQPQCDPQDKTNQALDVFNTIFLWAIFPASILTSAFGNQFLGMNSIDFIQTLGYSYYISYPLPDTMHNTLYQLRYYSFVNLNNIMRSAFLTNYNITQTQQQQYVIIDQQQINEPIYTYYELPSNFIYNGTIHFIVLFSINAVFGLVLLLYYNFPQQKYSFLYKTYSARKTFILRVYQFFAGDLFLLAAIQCTNIVFTTPLASTGFILAVITFLFLWLGFAFAFYLINMSKAKFEDKENQVLFNKLKKNDKINRNFYLIQIINKYLVVLFTVIFIGTYGAQIISVAIIQIMFALLVMLKIKLKKKRLQIYLILVNLSKIIVNCFLLMFALSSASQMIIAGWLFKVAILFILIIIVIFLGIEITSQMPEIATFLRQLKCCFHQNYIGGSSEQELQYQNYNSYSQSEKNTVYGIFNNNQTYERIVNEYLDQYKFEMPEEDEDSLLKDNENPENVEIDLNNHPQQNQNQNQEQNQDSFQNEFDPEEYMRRNED
ncbi:transmembrane protein, putative (macronuclear) [Tetrahymena thermophila SB210]|uniref:Transmembrane protein, putative n=1 Tax=Tetrahymena thermophila (strain SB210) TaxID=312017 RepID=Q22VZ7_TETTS|nr:transmembrane protein, putative [Tetrahymena thermophila SB210]EAR89619.2 transmembrane protein, putative [Tetrahymena thermophila SB210]|eukprot:XP_001009865.2 transmembrane protein, putative [Tetrahymena thermophila SB210]